MSNKESIVACQNIWDKLFNPTSFCSKASLNQFSGFVPLQISSTKAGYRMGLVDEATGAFRHILFE